MSFSRYPKYKASGVEWLGEVPAGWEVLPLKRIVEIPITDGPHETPQFVDEGVAFVSAEAVSSGKINFAKIRAYITLEDNARFSKKYSPKLNDIYMVKSGATTGVTAIVEDRTDFNIWSPLAVIRCNGGSVPYFVLNFMRSRHFLEAVTLFWSFGTQQNIGMGVIESLACTVPPIDEQMAIAAFLDRETLKVDGLVAEQRRLMELLKEKRQAVISHAVTKGLNPHAPMKPSGIEWLGDVPAVWEVLPVKFLARIGNGSTPNRDTAGYWEEGDYPWLNSSVVNQEQITEAEEFVTSLALKQCHLPKITPPAVLIGITGQGRTRGMASILMFEATINQHMAFLMPYANQAKASFLRRMFDNAYLFLRSDSDGGGSTKGAITCAQIANLKIPLPPLSEQIAIVAFIETELAKFNTLTAEAQRAIDLLQERRTALISAAVTGQIDVRPLTRSAA